MSRGKYNFASTVGVAITRGGPAAASSVPEALPLGGVDQGDGTAYLGVSGGGGGNGNSTATAIYTQTVVISAGAAAVEITQLVPPTTRFAAFVQNTGGNPGYIGPAGVTDATGFLVNSGQSPPVLPLGPTCPLYAYSPNGTQFTVMEFE